LPGRGSASPRSIRSPTRLSRANRSAGRSGGEVRPPEARIASAASSTMELNQGTEVQPTAAALSPAPDVQRPPPTDVDATTSSELELTPESAKSGSEERASRYLPVAVRKEVFERDEGCCTFVGANYQLQFHHKVPFGRGGHLADAITSADGNATVGQIRVPTVVLVDCGTRSGSCSRVTVSPAGAVLRAVENHAGEILDLAVAP
jgi:hypothetical protein